MSARLIDTKYDGLTTFSTWLFGVGHVMNDLCAAVWFNYLLYYLADVQRVDSATAGAVMLAGQLADGISTPLVGLYSDRFVTKIGKRKPWYIFGTILVPICFFWVFEECFPCSNLSGAADLAVSMIWYCAWAAFFNVGWAAIQISHLALIPQLSPLKETKDKLIGIRTGFTYIANIAVLLIALLLFKTISRPSLQFTVLTLIVLAGGGFINVMFILFINEVELSRIAGASYLQLGSLLNQNGTRNQEEQATKSEEVQTIEVEDSPMEEKKMTWRDWLKEKQIYPVGLCYMMARLANNVSTAMMPFYLTAVLGMGGVHTIEQASKKTPWELALIPLCMYIGSVSMSFYIKAITNYISRKVQFFIGTICVVVGSIPMLFLESSSQYVMVPLSIILGIGFTFELNNSQSFIAAFVGAQGTTGAFVWGIISLFDKFSSGIALFLLTNLGSLDDKEYIRITVTGLPLVASIAGTLILFFIKPQQEFSKVDAEKSKELE